jgi:HlyD family secretion protein
MVKIKLKNNSKIITDNNFKINKILLETFNSLFEIKIYNFQNYIIKKFSLQKKKLSFASCNNMILSNSPKFFFEILAFFTVLFFILYQVEFTNNYNNTLAYTAIYIVAGYKIMPYLQAILFSFSNIKGSVESLNKIYLATKLKEEMSLINITNKIKKIQFQDFSYGYKNQNIFDNSNISLKINELTGIYGESGSGKTTLANLLIGYLKINKGLIKINDSIIDKSIYNIYNKVSYVPQRVNLLNESIITNVTFKNKLSSTETDKLKIILLKTQLKKFITKNKISKKKINENNKNISGGQAQRISIARALYKESDVIVFDEFTSNLDSNTEKKIFQKLKSVFKNKIVIIITHQEILKKYCSKVYKLENNKLNEI